MNRAYVAGLTSPHPLGERLPAMYLEDSFVQRLAAALDDVLAPVFASLDNLDAYLDPGLAPEDFLQWLGGWVGLALDESWPVERRRAVLAEAAGLYRVRGTARGLTAYLRLLTGAEVEVDETGGTAYSTTADAAPPGSPNFAMVVRLRAPEGRELDPARIEALVAAAKPAHVVHRIELQAPRARERQAPTAPPTGLAGEGPGPEFPSPPEGEGQGGGRTAPDDGQDEGGPPA
jgi:phage tail-like protein